MGKINKGILGGFSGTVGTVVGGNWKGIDYMRSRPVSRTTYTPAQEVHRAKFGMVGRFVSIFKDLLKQCFQDFTGKMTGPNSALSYTMKNAVTGVYPDAGIAGRKCIA